MKTENMLMNYLIYILFIVKVLLNKIFLFIQAERDFQILKTKYTNCVSKVAIVLFMMIALK